MLGPSNPSTPVILTDLNAIFRWLSPIQSQDNPQRGMRARSWSDYPRPNLSSASSLGAWWKSGRGQLSPSQMPLTFLQGWMMWENGGSPGVRHPTRCALGYPYTCGSSQITATPGPTQPSTELPSLPFPALLQFMFKAQAYHHSVGWADTPTCPRPPTAMLLTTQWPTSLAVPHIQLSWPRGICGQLSATLQFFWSASTVYWLWLLSFPTLTLSMWPWALFSFPPIAGPLHLPSLSPHVMSFHPVVQRSTPPLRYTTTSSTRQSIALKFPSKSYCCLLATCYFLLATAKMHCQIGNCYCKNNKIL